MEPASEVLVLAGNTADFKLSDRRNMATAKAFFKKAIRYQGHAPHAVTLDGYAASHRAVREMQNADMLPKARNCGLRSI
jgi:transposase-like protein